MDLSLILSWLILALFFWAFYAIFKKYLIKTFSLPDIELASENDIPPAINSQMLKADDIVKELGFEPHHVEKIESSLAKEAQWIRCYYHLQSGVYAIVAQTLKSSDKPNIFFQSIFDFPDTLMSFNQRTCTMIPYRVNGRQIEALESDSFNEVFNHHLKVLKEIAKEPKRLDPDEFVRYRQTYTQYLYEEALKNGCFSQTKEGKYYITFKAMLAAFLRSSNKALRRL